jgi:hypothetical protein
MYKHLYTNLLGNKSLGGFFRSLKVISLLSMQKKMAMDIFTLKKDGAKRHQLRLRRINFQSSIFNSGLSGLGNFNLQAAG